MDRLKKKRDSLGKAKTFRAPEKEKVYGDYKETILVTGFISGVIIGIIAAIITTIIAWESIGVFAVLAGAFMGILIGIVGGFLCGLIIGPIIAQSEKNNAERISQSNYNIEMEQYNNNINRERQRIVYELQAKQKIDEEIKLLNIQIQKTNDFENRLTNLGILDYLYHHDIVATASFYQYFKSKRTFSLGFNPNTGDQGAYNIYEQERRLNIIIDKLDVVIQKLDQIERNQTVLFMCLTEANQKLEKINTSILKASSNIQSSIDSQTEMQRYSNECIRSELEYSNTLQMMNILHNW